MLNKENIKNPILKGFLNKKENRYLLKRYTKQPSKTNAEALNEAFKIHYLKVKELSYFTKVIHFEAVHFDKRKRNHSSKFSLTLDSPLKNQDNITRKEMLVDYSQDPTKIRLDKWEENIKNDSLRKSISKLTDIQKDTIKSYFYNGLKDKEISKLKGITSQAVSKARKEALKKIRREMNV